MATEIKNVGVDPLTLPSPLRGVLRGGQAIVLSTLTATLLAMVPSLVPSFLVLDLGASYAGSTDDSSYGPDPDASVARARAASTANLTLSGAQTIDGVSVVAGNVVLAKNQSTASQNGPYICRAGAWERSPLLPVGASAAGFQVLVEEGTVNADVTFLCTNNVGSDIVGTSNLVFASGAVVDSLLVHKAGAEDITGVKTFTAGAIFSTLQTLVVGAATLIGAIADRLNAAYLAITGQAIGDLLVADSANTFARLADVATGSVLKSGGVGVAPAYGPIGGTTAAGGTDAVTGRSAGETMSRLFRFENVAASGTARSAALAGNDAGAALAGFSNPAIPRAPQAVFGVGWDGGNLTVHGTNRKDAIISEVVADPGAGGATVQLIKPFKTITAAEKGAVGVNPATVQLQDGDAVGIDGSVDGAFGLLTADDVVEAVTVGAMYGTFVPTTPPNGAHDYTLLVNIDHDHEAGDLLGPSHAHGGAGLT